MRRIKLSKLLGGGSASSLALLLLAIFACPSFSGASAVGEYTGITNEADAVMASNDVGIANKVWVKPTISIALGSTEIELDTAKSVNNFVSGTANLKVSTNSTRGFKVLINSVGSASLVATDDSRNLIPPIPTKSTADKFPSTGGWGYYADVAAPNAGSEYYPTSTSAVVVKETDTSAAINDYKVGIGVKIDSTTPIGNYQNQLVVSVLANPIAAFNLAHITKMQEMTPEICAATQSYISVNEYAWKTLLDDRLNNDGTKQTYRVAKLADGNCWMQENLKLDLNANRPLTPNDSDVTANRTLPTTLTSITNSTDYAGKNSWHLSSKWYYQFNTATAGVGQNFTTDGQEVPDSICPKGWKLPLAGKLISSSNLSSGTFDKTPGSFKYLFDAQKITLNYTSLEAEPLWFKRVNFVYQGNFYSDDFGRYWSRVSSDSSNRAYLLNFTSSSVNTSSYSDIRYEGFPIRCVAVSTR